MNALHNTLIGILKLQAADGDSPANLLTDLLHISKEASYRRLRGEIQFTLDEAVIISKSLGFSLDNLIEYSLKDKYAFHIIPFTENALLEEYCHTLQGIMDTHYYIREDPDRFAYVVGKMVPPTLHFRYKEYTKFTLFKWVYLVQDSTKYATLADVKLSPKLEKMLDPFVAGAKTVPTTYIFTDFMFTALVKDLIYFYNIKLLSKTDIEIVTRDALLIIDDLEELASRGSYENGVPVSMYISDNHIDAAYHYIQGNGFKACGTGIYGLNFLSCIDNQICENHKLWIESLIRYSTSVTQGGIAQRIHFFNKQREKIKKILA